MYVYTYMYNYMSRQTLAEISIPDWPVKRGCESPFDVEVQAVLLKAYAVILLTTGHGMYGMRTVLSTEHTILGMVCILYI